MGAPARFSRLPDGACVTDHHDTYRRDQELRVYEWDDVCPSDPDTNEQLMYYYHNRDNNVNDPDTFRLDSLLRHKRTGEGNVPDY